MKISLLRCLFGAALLGIAAPVGAHGCEPLDKYLMEYLVEPSMRATVMASSLAATLELVREGALEVHQQSAFAPIYLRKRDEAALAAVNSSTAMPRATE